MKNTCRLSMTLASLALVFLTGCAAKLEALYTVPGSSVKTANLSDISPLEITVTVTASGNVKASPLALSEGLRQHVAARLSHEGALKTLDPIADNEAGAAKVEAFAASRRSAHGYARHIPSQNAGAATLHLDVTLAMDGKIEKKTQVFSLQTIPYVRTDNGGVNERPASAPDYEKKSVEERAVPYEVLVMTARGSLDARLVNRAGEEVYRRRLPLEYTVANSLQEHEAPLTSNALFEQALFRAVEKVVADVSPHQMRRELKANRKGNKTGVLLLEAFAYAEAIAFLEDMKGKQPADFENLGLAYEILGDYTFAAEAYKEGNCTERLAVLEQHKAAIAGDKADAGVVVPLQEVRLEYQRDKGTVRTQGGAALKEAASGLRAGFGTLKNGLMGKASSSEQN